MFPLLFDFCMLSSRNLCGLKKGAIPAKPAKPQVSRQLLLTSYIVSIPQF